MHNYFSTRSSNTYKVTTHLDLVTFPSNYFRRRSPVKWPYVKISSKILRVIRDTTPSVSVQTLRFTECEILVYATSLAASFLARSSTFVMCWSYVWRNKRMDEGVCLNEPEVVDSVQDNFRPAGYRGRSVFRTQSDGRLSTKGKGETVETKSEFW